MDGRDLVRSVKAVGSVGPTRGMRVVRAAWRRHRADLAGLPSGGRERARVPGALVAAEPGPGGGTVRFARAELAIAVTVGGAVFWGWDGAGPLPSYGLAGAAPEPDPRAVLEPDKDGGWRVVAERVTVAVSRVGGIEVLTPGGVRLRRDDPPRWWEPVAGGGGRWLQRSAVAADARFFGLGGRASGPRLRDGTYRLWNADPGAEPRAARITMPTQLVVADAGTHLVFHDTTWDAAVTLREGVEGAGSGHDRAGSCVLRAAGGPLRCWVVVGTPARVLHTWAVLTGGPVVPPGWAHGHHQLRAGGGEAELRRTVEGHRARGLPLGAVHLDLGHTDGGRAFSVDGERFPKLPQLAQELEVSGVRLVAAVGPGVRAERGGAVFEAGTAAGVFVRDAAGRAVRGEARGGESVYPDFTLPRARAWWGGWYGEGVGRGFAGFWHDADELVASPVFGEPALPRSSRHDLDGRPGDHRAAHNVYGLGMARAAQEGLAAARPDEAPFVLSRSGWAGMQRYGGAWCGGAPGWEGLRAGLALVLGLGLCGVAYAGPDVGGGDTELVLRRLQLAAYLPLLRTRGPLGADGRELWELGDAAVEHARVALAERERLRPYFTTLAHLARRTGAPYVRPLWWGSPGDRALRDCEDAFLLGDALLVAPVFAPGARSRRVRLPWGRWYDTATGGVYEGPGSVVLDAPLSRIPVLARAGAVVPVLGHGEKGGSGGSTARVVLDAWAPQRGRTGRGELLAEDGADAVLERYAARWSGGGVVVERKGPGRPRATERPVRVRGL
ncbi:glycoside hydrolase family 31 protein [Streptomyces sp. NPDC050560]|uniref:glycoside hydrolase family 31 protein n=1 Tax=Streptomyces sp. NPDC050560 TaxID=3365630 RepID=UPI00379BF23C